MKRRLIWIAAILSAAILYLFENNAATLALLACTLILPAVGSLPLAGAGISAELVLDKPQEKCQSVGGKLVVANRSVLPKPRLRITLVCRNIRTGEEALTTADMSLLPKQTRQIPLSFSCPHCGKIELTASEITLGDLFGLFSRAVKQQPKCAVTIPPRLFAPVVTLKSAAASLDSDLYFPDRAGNDAGEPYDIREYVPGDAVRRIHWKLSEKSGKLLVRELAMPISNDVALLFDPFKEQDASQADALTEVFASVSFALLNAGAAHHVFWQDAQSGAIVDFPVTDESAFASMLEALLALPPKSDVSAAERFAQAFSDFPYAHIVIAACQIPNTEAFRSGSRVSVLLAQNTPAAEGLQPDGSRLFCFRADHYAVDLGSLEV